MSGHSKWATTHRQKAIVDAKRGAIFTKIGNQIAIAARGGTDPTTNSALAMAIEKAKAANMPNANIQRAIDRVNDKNAAALEEVTYEAYGPGGVGIIVEAATDNKNRTYPEVRTALTKNGGTMADAGSVMFQFTRKGVIRVAATGEDALLQVLDAGAEDLKAEDDVFEIYTTPEDFDAVEQALADAGIETEVAKITMIPDTTIELSGDDAVKMQKMLDVLDDLDDVQNVYHNGILPDDEE